MESLEWPKGASKSHRCPNHALGSRSRLIIIIIAGCVRAGMREVTAEFARELGRQFEVNELPEADLPKDLQGLGVAVLSVHGVRSVDGVHDAP